MKYKIIPVTPFQQNCNLIWCDKTNKAAIVDPGGDVDRIIAEVEKQGVHVEKILLTHGHIDHVGGATELAQRLNVAIIGPHKDDQFLLDDLADQSRMFQFKPCDTFVPAQYLNDGDVVTVGDLSLQVCHCPGHTPGHVVFFEPISKTAWVGDVLFKGSIGRTDFPQSSHPALIDSITKKLWPLGGEVEFIPGHGPSSTFAQERRSNPFVADQLFG